MYDKRVDDITGKVFGNLTAIKRTENRSGKNSQYLLWECKCKCGNSILTEAYKLKRGRKRSCGCLEGTGRPYNFKEDRTIPLWNRLFSSTIQKRSKGKNYESDIDIDFFIITSQKECCYCGDKGTQRLKDRSTDTEIYFNGIDRVDSSIGYMKNNIVSCCKHCNTAKNIMSQEEFKNHIRKMYEYFANK